MSLKNDLFMLSDSLINGMIEVLNRLIKNEARKQ